MEKCSPGVMRKNLEIVDGMSKAGLDFIVIPVLDEDHKQVLMQQAREACNKLADLIEKEWE